MNGSTALMALAIFTNLALPATARQIPESTSRINEDTSYLQIVDTALDEDNNPLKEIMTSAEKIQHGKSVCHSLKQDNISLQTWVENAIEGIVQSNDNPFFTRSAAYYMGTVGAAGIYSYCPEYSDQVTQLINVGEFQK